MVQILFIRIENIEYLWNGWFILFNNTPWFWSMIEYICCLILVGIWMMSIITITMSSMKQKEAKSLKNTQKIDIVMDELRFDRNSPIDFHLRLLSCWRKKWDVGWISFFFSFWTMWSIRVKWKIKTRNICSEYNRVHETNKFKED